MSTASVAASRWLAAISLTGVLIAVGGPAIIADTLAARIGLGAVALAMAAYAAGLTVFLFTGRRLGWLK